MSMPSSPLRRATSVNDGYGAARIAWSLARQQPGVLGVERARDVNGLGITVSYPKVMSS